MQKFTLSIHKLS